MFLYDIQQPKKVISVIITLQEKPSSPWKLHLSKKRLFQSLSPYLQEERVCHTPGFRLNNWYSNTT